MTATAIVMAVILLVGLGIFAWETVSRLKWARVGREDIRWDGVRARIDRVMQNVFGQKKLRQRSWRGTMHVMFFYGFLVLQSVMLQVVGEGLFGLDFTIPLIGGPVLYLIQDVVSALVLVAIGMAVHQRYIKKNPHVKAHSEFDAIIVLVGIGGLILTSFMTNAGKVALGEMSAADCPPNDTSPGRS